MNSSFHVFPGMTRERLDEILASISSVNIGFIGDICIDVYWFADMRRSELSRETPHYPLPVVREYYQPGAGGNVLNNLAALCPRSINAVGVIGDDWRAVLIERELKRLSVSDELIIRRSDCTTYAYCKPMRQGISDTVYEDPRIDFSSPPVDEHTERRIIENIQRMAEKSDIICVSDQFANGLVTERVRDSINELARSGRMVIVDSRDHIGDYRHVLIKPNEVETARAARALGDDTDFAAEGLGGFVRAAKTVMDRTGCEVCMTLGGLGNMQLTSGGACHVPSREVKGELDICGAGDTFLSAYTAATAAGADRREAGQLGNMASEVTIKKIGQTGTATREEITARFVGAY